MNLIFDAIFPLILTISVTHCQRESADRDSPQRVQKEKLIWCTISTAEFKKCQDWSESVRRSRVVPFEFDLECGHANDKDQCMNLIENGQSSMVTLDPGEVFVSGRYHSLVPIMSEQYNMQKDGGYYAVAVVKTESSSFIRDLRDLRGRSACFTGVGHMSGWVIPMARLLDEYNLMEIRDCNNIIKSAAAFFGQSCAPNSLIDKYNPTGDNPQSMCQLCIAGTSGVSRCSGGDDYANFEGAFKCLSRVGDVAFLKHTTVEQMTRRRTFGTLNKYQFELLCPNGGRRNIDSYLDCNWGFVPAHAVVVSSATSPEKRIKIQHFLIESFKRFGINTDQYNFYGSTRTSTLRPNINRFNQTQFTVAQSQTLNIDKNTLNNTFSLIGDSFPRYGDSNLLFSDEVTGLISVINSRQTFAGYLGSYPIPSSGRGGGRNENFLPYFNKLRKCPVPNARFCVFSEKEMEKCNRMKTAFRSQMLKPEITCIKEHSSIRCMAMIRDGTADLTVLDAGDIYTGGHRFRLEPIVAEQYNLNETAYYVVAVSRTSDQNTDLLYLKGKRSCHTGFGMASGWVIPLSFLISNDRMRSYGCDSARAASEFFQKSCAPGALSREHYSHGNMWDYGNLCDLCHGASYRFCSRDSSEPFFGDTGALRCLVEGGGDIAFVKHTTIVQNTAGRNPQWWSRNVIPEDFELHCRDGTRDSYWAYQRCNLGKVSSNAIVTNKYKEELHKEAYINLFLYAQQYYGSKYSEDFTFKMFVSEEGYHDLIFQDATQQLRVIQRYKRDYKTYLGHDFLKAMTIVDCTAGATDIRLSFVNYLLIAVITIFMKYFNLIICN